MKIGIVGLPNVGKSTLFNALTKNYSADAQNFPFCTIEPNVGMVNVFDSRLEKIRMAVGGQKVIPATCEFIDIAGIVKGASEGEGLGNKFLANIREADAILQVVRVFEDGDIIHVHGEVNPKSDIEVINSELILADIDTIEKRIIKDGRKAKSDKEIAVQFATIEKVLAELNNGKLVSDLDLNEDEKEHIRDLHLLTNKKFVYACNVSEDMMDTPEDKLKDIIGITNADTRVVPICAKLEADMIEMNETERKEFLEEMGLITTGLDNLIKASYDALGLMYYFTAGEKEVRAWTIHKGDTAPQAAGVIHTDFEKGFIKADVVNWAFLVEFGGWSKAREAGKVSLEGKDYIVQDGDVMLFKFNN
ncbi:MAG: redox-regulated ATPase YchF [Candidatus Gracilibacteria bacterium]|nr:redox-regulated ATPase YchF [Candidatus Gracilibacteria bacterium]